MSTTAFHSRRHLSHLHETPSPLEGGGRLLHWRYNEFDDHNFQIHGHTILYLFILFGVVLLATLLLLYARWFFRLRRPATAPLPGPNYPRPNLHPRPAPKGLDLATIHSLPITLHVASDVAEDGMLHDLECCICLAAFDDGDKVKILPGCSHRYHSTCVDTWLTGHSSCPLCRLPVRPVPVDSCPV